MLNSLTFNKDYRCFKKNESFSFISGVNLLVGEQGTGKSTLLSVIHNPKDVTIDGDGAFAFFDFEKSNPHIPHGAFSDKLSINAQVAAMWSSHGQVVNSVLGYLNHVEVNTLVLMDEPDMALSVRSCTKLVALMKECAERGCQIIASVHNPIVISGFDEVYSLEHRRWMQSSEFVRLHLDT